MGQQGLIDIKSLTRFLKNFPLGIFLGTVTTLTFVWFWDSNLSATIERNISSLFGAIVGLIAATLVVAGVLSNMANQNHLVDKQRRAKLSAAKAVLPLVLSQMAAVARRGAEISIAQNVAAVTREGVAAELTMPKETITSLQSTIEQSDRQDGQRLANLIRYYQVAHSRTTQHILENNFQHRTNLDFALDWAVLYRLVEDCFEFSRQEAPHIPDRLDRLELRVFFSVNLRANHALILELEPLILAREQRTHVEMFAQDMPVTEFD